MYDLIIAGAGLTGLSLCHLLYQQGAKPRVLLVDPSPEPLYAPYSPSFDDRSSALSLDSVQRLDALLPSSWRAPLAAMHSIDVSEQGMLGHCLLQAEQQGVPFFGLVCPNAWLGQQLWQQRPAHAELEFSWQTQVIGSQVLADRRLIQLSDGRELSCACLIVADGGRSNLLKQLGIASHQHAYQQYAHVVNAVFAEPIAGRAFERFTPQGTLAALPLAQLGHYALVLIDSQPLNEQQLYQQVQQRLGWRLGRLQQLGKAQHYPLVKRQSQELVRQRLALCGNAALALHPVAGQGFNLALRGASRLAEVLRPAWQQQQDLGELNRLQHYQQQQWPDLQQIGAFSHGLVQLFDQQHSLIRHGRSVGLNLMASSPRAKGLFAHFAMGRPKQPNL